KSLWRTEDGGRSWQEIGPVRDGRPAYLTVAMALKFRSTLDGSVWFECFDPEIVIERRTRDGGRTWSSSKGSGKLPAAQPAARGWSLETGDDVLIVTSATVQERIPREVVLKGKRVELP